MFITVAARTALVVSLAGLLGVPQVTGQRPSPNPAPPPPPGLVLAYAAVERANGTIATGLSRDDFRVLVDGLPQKIEYFSAEKRPVTIMLLLDASSSYTNRVGALVLRSAIDQSCLPGLEPSDRMRIGGISARLFISPFFTNDRRALIISVGQALTPPDTERFGPTPLWDAVDSAVALLAPEPGLRAIVLLTDGRSTANRASYTDVASRAIAADVMINVLGKDTQEVVVQEKGIIVRGEPEVALKVLTDLTGGLMRSDNRVRIAPGVAADGSIMPTRASDSSIGRLLARVMNQLHQLYTIGFAPTVRDGKLHTVDVQATLPGLIVRARQAYK